MKKHSRYLLTFCVVALGVMTAHTSTAQAARCPDPGVVNSFNAEASPELECLQIEMNGKCRAVELRIKNLCEKALTLQQTEPECESNDERSECVTKVLKPESLHWSESFKSWTSYRIAEDQNIVLEGTYGDAPLLVKVTYSATIVPYPTSSCGCSSLNQTAPLAPLSLLGALALAGTVTVRNRRRR